MRIHLLERELHLPRPREEVFEFFSEASNLEELTPLWLRFRIATPAPPRMAAGATIRYRLRIHGIPIGWTSEITAWEPPRRFIDEQARGPYRLWVHEHIFEDAGSGTRVRDRVRWALRGGTIGDRLLSRFVERDLERIFQFRHERLLARFGGDGTVTPQAG